MELALAQHGGKHLEGALRGGLGKFLLLIDGYEELRSPVNIWDQNNFEDWEKDIKILISCRSDYLKPF